MKSKMERNEPRIFPPSGIEQSLTDLEIRCHHVPWDGRTAFCLMGRDVAPNDRRRYYMATNVTFEPVEEGQELQPTFKLRRDQVQALMDELWRVGVRPSEAGSAGELEATKAHLRDMRALVGKSIDVPELRGNR
jgi:hypothetical protein